jgi:(p)ppGpp synthase/HD superfamily hydrolase
MSNSEILSSLPREEVLKFLNENTLSDPKILRQLKNTSLATRIRGELFYDKMGKPIELDFVPIFQLSEDERRNRGKLWSVYFGKDGLSADKAPEKQEEEMEMLETAFGLASYAHQGQRRQTGEAYINHPLRAAVRTAKVHKVPLRTTVGLLLHDTVEDSEGVVTLDHIRIFFGEEVAEMVDGLTKVRKLQKNAVGEKEVFEEVTDRTATEYKLINAMMVDKSDKDGLRKPLKLAYKMSGDIFDNINTLEGKNPGDRKNIALYTLQYWARLAEIFGMSEEAKFLYDKCFEIIDEGSHNDNFANKIKQGIDTYLDSVNKNLLQDITADTISELNEPLNLGLVKIDVATPGIYEIASSQSGERKTSPENFFLKMTVVLSDDNSPEFTFKSRLALTQLLNNDNFSLPEESDIESFYRQNISATGNSQPNVTVSYHEGSREVPVKINFKTRSQYDLETTPVTYLEATELMDKDKKTLDYTLEERRALAEIKLQNITGLFRTIAENPDMTTEDLFPSAMATLPNSIIVHGLKRKKEWLGAPVPPGSTVMDYALLHIPGSWHNLKPVFRINGKVETNFSRVLRSGDRIEFEIGEKDENNTQFEQLDASITYPNAISIIAPRLEEKMNTLTGKERRSIEKKIAHRGWSILNKMSGKFLDKFGLSYAKEAFPNPEMNPRDLAYQVGMGKVDNETVENIANYLKERWNNFTVLRVRISKADRSGKASPVLNLLRENSINIVSFNSASKWGDTATIILRFNKSDPNYCYLEPVIRTIEEKLGYETLLFNTEEKHLKWKDLTSTDFD